MEFAIAWTVWIMTAEDCCVSVLVPVYNSGATLQRAVHSALGQDLRDLEVVVIDDGSRDHTNSIACALAVADARVRPITLPRNHGKPFAMNTGIAAARGRWIAVLDADDWYAPDRLSTLIALAEKKQVPLVADNQFHYDDGAAQVVRTAFPVQDTGRLLDKATFIAGSDPYSDFNFGMLKPVVRSEFIRSTGLAYHENAKLSEDFLYMLEFLAAGGRGWLVERPLYYWSQAFGTISRRWTETGAGKWRYNFLSAAAANAEVQSAMQRAGEDELAALLQRRTRAFERLHWLQEVSRLRADGAAPTQVARTVLGHPSIWPLVAQRGVRHALKAISVRSPVRA
jgi:succinoglycan biosynthesis protein ExoO